MMRNSKLKPKATLTRVVVKKSINDSTSSENRPETGEIKFGTKNRPETGEISFGGSKKKTGSYLVRKTKIESPRMETKPLNSMKVSSNASKIGKAAGEAYGDVSKKVNDVKQAINAAAKVAKYGKFN